MADTYTYIGPSLYANETLKPYDTISFETLKIMFDGSVVEVVPSIKKDLNLINESIFRILNTEKGERVYLRDFGCNLKSYIFEPLDSITVELIIKEIREALGKWEPRIRVEDIAVEKVGDHKILITLLYSVLLDKKYLVKAQFTI